MSENAEMPSIRLPQLAIARRGPDDPLRSRLGRDAGLEALSEDIVVWPSEIEGKARNRCRIPRLPAVPSRVNAGPPPVPCIATPMDGRS